MSERSDQFRGYLAGVGEAIAVTIDVLDGRIRSIRYEPQAKESENDSKIWILPAVWDIQTNGRWEISYSDPKLTAQQVIQIVRAQPSLGTTRLLPTLITGSAEAFLHGVRTIAAACDADPLVDRMVAGIHLEGPAISEVEGYRGAHPEEHVRDWTFSEYHALQEASGGRIKLITLAPERPLSLEFIRAVTAEGVVVSLGHTAANTHEITAAVDAGATLSTHLGNGIASNLARHPNPIWTQAAEDRLSASLICDGHHLSRDVTCVIARSKGPDRVILVSDHSPLAGMPEGTYGPWAVDRSGKIVVAGTPYLAGSNQDLPVGVANLMAATGWDFAKVAGSITCNPARLLGQSLPVLEIGDLWEGSIWAVTESESAQPEIRVLETWVAGEQFMA
jgi:N-acetylglucosamine-6-phosphate deacetylase